MDEQKPVLTRRNFLRAGSCVALGGLMGAVLPGSASAESVEKSRVVLIRNQDVLNDSGNLNGQTLAEMLDEAVMALHSSTSAEEAWKRIAGPDEVVGIKSNHWNALRTPRELEDAIRARLIQAGVKPDNIAVDDRGALRNPVFQNCTALINSRPMRAHHWAGLGTLLKNYIMFVPEPWKYHDNACENLGAIWKLPHVSGRTRLNILVMLTPLFHGVGPHNFSERYVWQYKGLIVSADPVAADATGSRIIQAKRNLFFGKESPISPQPRHILAADVKFGLGRFQTEHIELIARGWDEDRLI